MSYYWFLDHGRGKGKTHAICEAAKTIGAAVVVHSEGERKRVEETYGVTAVVLGQVLRGRTADMPYLIDPHAASLELIRLETQIGRLQVEIRHLDGRRADALRACEAAVAALAKK